MGMIEMRPLPPFDFRHSRAWVSMPDFFREEGLAFKLFKTFGGQSELESLCSTMDKSKKKFN